MATECDASKSRRLDLGKSRRTRRSTSLVACYQDQHVPPLAQQLRQDENLKTLFQCQDTELQPPHPYEDQDLRILLAPLQREGDKQRTPNQYLDEQEKKLHRYLDEEEKKPHQHHDDERKIPEQHHDEEQKTLQQCQDEEKMMPLQYQDEGEKTPNQYEDEENTPGQKTARQCQEEEEGEEKTSAKNQDEDLKAPEAQKQCQDTEQKAPEQYKSVKKKLTTPPCAGNVSRFSLQELIQEKQLLSGGVKAASKLGHGEKAIADHKISPAPAPAPATGGATLAMVIKRPDGGKKSMGVIRRCVKALNQMVKGKHGSNKKAPF
ncbi:hypothetical protein GUJ93_ZPchr0007g3179 [Zizania palustris]|uniref:Uncharacterized protein n=1 Tax=Zizania palustris TaxID=103762 RepID=A0A8J5TFP9_ZIZPA|nr:hypothetical protein GUJ93_ZPchr0007g3179 [Zizania palustris]